MNKTARWLAILGVCALSPAFAGPAGASDADQTAPPAPAPSAAPQNAAPATATPTSAQGAQSADKKDAGISPSSSATPSAAGTPDDKEISPATLKKLLSQGYRPKHRDGNVVYCRKESKINSRLETEICRNADDIARDERDSKKMLDQVQRVGDDSMHK